MMARIAILLFLVPIGVKHFNDPYVSQPENVGPEVEIVWPSQEKGFIWNAIVPYRIHVSDPEDGDSAYGEIINHEVFLEIEYRSDTSEVSGYWEPKKRANRDILRLMSKANCLSCHAARSKLIGPSFELIAERYSPLSDSIDKLVNKLIKGSKGTWGDEPMPPQPELAIAHAREMVEWILSLNNHANYTFYIGTEGAFRTREKNESGGFYVLLASYQDHGFGNIPDSKKEAVHKLILRESRGE